MEQPQLFFDRITKTQKETKDLKTMINDALVNSSSYQEAIKEGKLINEKKKKIKDDILEDFISEVDKLSILKIDKENDEMLLSDASMTKLMKGETVEVEDEFGNKYEPIISVKFKKV